MVWGRESATFDPPRTTMWTREAHRNRTGSGAPAGERGRLDDVMAPTSHFGRRGIELAVHLPSVPACGPEGICMDDDGGHDPDYRFTLANERTFLSWIRTALALIAGGVAVVQLVPDFGFPGSRRIVGALLAGMGVAL